MKSNYDLNIGSTNKKTVGTILHGAYGDYFEQLLCISDLASKNNNHEFIIFFANKYRMKEFSKLDYPFASKTLHVSEIKNNPIDIFYQFQINDKELQEEVFKKLPPETLSKFDFECNLLPHVYMRYITQKPFQLLFNDKGCESIEKIKETLPSNFFDSLTIGFMWRYRKKGGAIKPYLMPSEETLVEKYSALFKYVVEELNCNVLIAGMNVKTTDENRFFVDAKFPEFALNYHHEKVCYLPGKSWLAEVEVLSKCDIVICNPSGFSEAIYLLGKDCILVDPPLDYLLKMLKNRAPVFNIGISNPSQIKELLLNTCQLKSLQYLKDNITEKINKVSTMKVKLGNID